MSSSNDARVTTMTRAALDTLCGALDVAISDEARSELIAFAELVERWNARIDLTAAKGAEQLCEVLFADALVLCDEALVPREARIVDIGSGAGAPALPLLILRRDLRAVLIEPLKKRTAFMRTVIGSIASLTGRVEVRDGRIDTSSPEVAGMPFDLAMSRATFAPSEWLAAGRKLAASTIVLVARDDDPLESLTRIRREYTLPRTGAHREIRVYDR